MVKTLRKLVWVFEFWNEMLVSNVKCKICWKARVSEGFLLEFWEERGEKLITCHLFLDNFSWNLMTLGLFSKVKSFWNGVLFQENSNIIILKLWILSFWTLFLQKMCFCRNFDCVFRACNSRIVTYDEEFLSFVVWFLYFNHCYGIFFWKVSSKEIMMLSKTCVSFRNRIFKRLE
jgi:hypothetical protein